MTEIPVGFTIVIPGSMDPGMHFGLEVKRLKNPLVSMVYAEIFQRCEE